MAEVEEPLEFKRKQKAKKMITTLPIQHIPKDASKIPAGFETNKNPEHIFIKNFNFKSSAPDIEDYLNFIHTSQLWDFIQENSPFRTLYEKYKAVQETK